MTIIIPPSPNPSTAAPTAASRNERHHGDGKGKGEREQSYPSDEESNAIYDSPGLVGQPPSEVAAFSVKREDTATPTEVQGAIQENGPRFEPDDIVSGVAALFIKREDATTPNEMQGAIQENGRIKREDTTIKREDTTITEVQGAIQENGPVKREDATIKREDTTTPNETNARQMPREQRQEAVAAASSTRFTCPYNIGSEFEVPDDFETNDARVSFNDTSAPVTEIIRRKDGRFNYVLKVEGTVEILGGSTSSIKKGTFRTACTDHDHVVSLEATVKKNGERKELNMINHM